MLAIQCVAYRINLAVEELNNYPVMKEIKNCA
jgi:hypothetical protein